MDTGAEDAAALLRALARSTREARTVLPELSASEAQLRRRAAGEPLSDEDAARRDDLGRTAYRRPDAAPIPDDAVRDAASALQALDFRVRAEREAFDATLAAAVAELAARQALRGRRRRISLIAGAAVLVVALLASGVAFQVASTSPDRPDPRVAVPGGDTTASALPEPSASPTAPSPDPTPLETTYPPEGFTLAGDGFVADDADLDTLERVEADILDARRLARWQGWTILSGTSRSMPGAVCLAFVRRDAGNSLSQGATNCSAGPEESQVTLEFSVDPTSYRLDVSDAALTISATLASDGSLTVDGGLG